MLLWTNFVVLTTSYTFVSINMIIRTTMLMSPQSMLTKIQHNILRQLINEKYKICTSPNVKRDRKRHVNLSTDKWKRSKVANTHIYTPTEKHLPTGHRCQSVWVSEADKMIWRKAITPLKARGHTTICFWERIRDKPDQRLETTSRQVQNESLTSYSMVF